MVRSAYSLRAEDDDFGQAGTMVRAYWKNVDQRLGERVEQAVGATVGA
jgi:catalase